MPTEVQPFTAEEIAAAVARNDHRRIIQSRNETDIYLLREVGWRDDDFDCEYDLLHRECCIEDIDRCLATIQKLAVTAKNAMVRVRERDERIAGLERKVADLRGKNNEEHGEGR